MTRTVRRNDALIEKNNPKTSWLSDKKKLSMDQDKCKSIHNLDSRQRESRWFSFENSSERIDHDKKNARHDLQDRKRSV